MKLGYSDVFPHRELWENVSQKFNGVFKISFNSGSELEIHQLTIPFKKWELLISESDTRPLKFEIKFDVSFDYQLTIGQEDTIDKLMKRLGLKEIEIGNRKFDDKYLIKSNNTDLTINLFTKEIVDIFLKYNLYSISYMLNKYKQTSKLISVISYAIDNEKAFEALINLHFSFVQKLSELKIVN